jgi:hypothetical protein
MLDSMICNCRIQCQRWTWRTGKVRLGGQSYKTNCMQQSGSVRAFLTSCNLFEGAVGLFRKTGRVQNPSLNEDSKKQILFQRDVVVAVVVKH